MLDAKIVYRLLFIAILFKVFVGNTDDVEVVTHVLPVTFISRYVKIIINSWNIEPALRFDILGNHGKVQFLIFFTAASSIRRSTHMLIFAKEKQGNPEKNPSPWHDREQYIKQNLLTYVFGPELGVEAGPQR